MAYDSHRQAHCVRAPHYPHHYCSIKVAMSSRRWAMALAFIDLTRALLRVTYEQYRADLRAHSYHVEQPLFPRGVGVCTSGAPDGTHSDGRATSCRL